MLYGKDGMSLMWMPAQTTEPPRSTALRARGTRAPSGAKRMAASSGTGGSCCESPAQECAQAQGQGLCADIALPREGIHFPPLKAAHLRKDVGGRAEAIEADPPRRLTRQAERAIPDEAGAEKGGHVEVRVAGGKRKTEPRVRHGILGKAAIDVVPGEPGLRAEIFTAARTEGARAAGRSQPGDPHAVPHGKTDHPLPDLRHGPHHLVARHEGSFGSESSPSTM